MILYLCVFVYIAEIISFRTCAPCVYGCLTIHMKGDADDFECEYMDQSMRMSMRIRMNMRMGMEMKMRMTKGVGIRMGISNDSAPLNRFGTVLTSAPGLKVLLPSRRAYTCGYTNISLSLSLFFFFFSKVTQTAIHNSLNDQLRAYALTTAYIQGLMAYYEPRREANGSKGAPHALLSTSAYIDGLPQLQTLKAAAARHSWRKRPLAKNARTFIHSCMYMCHPYVYIYIYMYIHYTYIYIHIYVCFT
jgi:hypothetical protein